MNEHASEEEKTCLNCKLVFRGVGSACPRCNSKNVRKNVSAKPERKAAVAHPASDAAKRAPFRAVYGDTKNAWQSFHNTSVTQCPACGSTEFENDFKHKQKYCKKCGEIISLRRRPS